MPLQACRGDNGQAREVVIQLVVKDRRLKVPEMGKALDISEGNVHTIFIYHLGMRKLSVRWVPSDDQKALRASMCQALLTQCSRDADNFMERIVTGDETWVHHFDPETKNRSTTNSSLTTTVQTQAPPVIRHQPTTTPSTTDVFDTDAGKIVIVLLVMLLLLLLFLAVVIFFAFRTYAKLQRLLRKSHADTRQVKNRTTQTRLTGEDMDEYRSLNGIYMGTYQGRQLGINYMPSRWHKVHPDWSDPWATKYPLSNTQHLDKND